MFRKKSDGSVNGVSVSKWIPLVVGGIIAIRVLASTVVIIPTGYTGVKVRFGQVQERTLPSGTVNFCIPFVDSIHKVNNKQKTKSIDAQIWGETSDKTPVYASGVQVTYQILPGKATWLYSNVSSLDAIPDEYLVASAVKSAMVELAPDEVTKRNTIEGLVQQKLAEALAQKYGEDAVYVNHITINNMDFEDAYNDAIQARSIAQQTAAKQKIENQTAIEKAEADKKVAITKAEAEAEKTKIEAEAQAAANRALADSLSDVLVEYEKVQKWDGKLPSVTGTDAMIQFGTGAETQ